MDVERKVVLTDVAMALSWIVLGVLFAEPAAADLWWLAAPLAIGIVASTWVSEHGVVSEWLPVAGVVAFGVALFAVALTDGPTLVGTLIPLTLAGMGVGLLVYRLYFGLVRPVPEYRLRRAQ